jgi:hypothetical protein
MSDIRDARSELLSFWDLVVRDPDQNAKHLFYMYPTVPFLSFTFASFHSHSRSISRS